MLYKSPSRKETTVPYQVTVRKDMIENFTISVKSPVSSVVEHQTFNLRAVGSIPTSGV